MGRLQNLLSDLKLNKEIKRWRNLELKKIHRPEERRIINGFSLSKSEKDSIDTFFVKHTGHKVNYFWHLKYKIVSGNFHYDFFPEVYYNADLKHRLNSKTYSEIFQNKYILSQYINGAKIGVKTPFNIISCNETILLNENNERISKEEAKRIIKTKGKVFIKKSLDTYGGKDCLLLNKPSDNEIDNLLNNYSRNYLIQDVIENQDDLSQLNPSTLNTFRVITFYANGEFRTSPIILRIGRKNKFIDNAHAGGMFVGVSDAGVIISDAKTTKGETFKEHPDSHILFKGYRIKNVDVLKQKAIQLANLFPKTKLIDWDLTIDKSGNIICIEANINSGSIWLMQMTHGTPVFGDYTPEMLKYVHVDSFFKIFFNNIKK